MIVCAIDLGTGVLFGFAPHKTRELMGHSFWLDINVSKNWCVGRTVGEAVGFSNFHVNIDMLVYLFA